MTVFGIGVILSYCIFSNISDKLFHTEFSYFLCNLFGDNPECESIRRQHDRILLPCLTIFLFLAVALFPWVQLLLAIQFQDVKKAVKWISTKVHMESSTRDT